MKNKLLSKYMFIVGMLMVVLTMILLTSHMFLPVSIIKALPIVIAVLLGLILILSILQMITSKQTIAKFAALPLMVSFFVIAFFLIKLPIYPMLMSALTGEPYDVDSDVLFENMKLGFTIFQYGIWISVIPIFVAAFFMTKNSSTKTPKNIDEYYPRKAKVLSYEFSNVKINNVPLYELVLEIQDYEEIYTVKKNIKARHYELFTYHVGDMIEVLIDPNKKKKVVIKSSDMYI